MTDDGNAPTIPDTQAPTHGPSSPTLTPKPPDSRYALRALLGKGGMGEVWLAHDLRIDRDIAIKLMRGGGSKDAEAIARFLREARVQGRLEHPSVVPVHDLGGADGSPFFAMKRLTGITLAEVIARPDPDKWPRRGLLARFIDVCLAIEFAHKRGVVHRDLKPANIMLGDFGEAYVLDWGLARIDDTIDSGVIRNSDLPSEGDVGHTEVGAMLGTPGYMPPEQMRGEPIDPRADVFALGCILFEVLCGAPAIPRDKLLETTLTAPCYRPRRRAGDVPPELDEICARATAASAGDRFASARELADAVQRFLDGDRDLARRRELAVGHVKRAQQLLAHDSPQTRSEAMGEAGSAIALDASNRDAQAVLARLLLEPPAEIPPAVHAEIERERQASMQGLVRRAFLLYSVWLAMVPLSYVVGIVGGWPVISVAAALGLIVVLLGVALWRKWYISRTLVMIAGGLHLLVLVTIGVALGPLLVLPILLFGAHPILLMMPSLRFPKLIFTLHVLAAGIPIALEWFEILPRTYSTAGNALVLQPWAVTITPEALVLFVCAIVFLQLAGNTVILDAQRVAQDLAKQQLHVQKWQLEQLVPSSRSSA